MGFIKGRAYPIISAMAKDGNEKAKKLLEGVDSMDQDQVDSMISEIFNSKTTGDNSIKDLKNQNFNNLAKGESKKGNWKSDLEDQEFEQELQLRLGSKTKKPEEKATLEKTVVPIMPRGGLSKEQQADLKDEEVVGNTLTTEIKEILDQKGDISDYEIESLAKTYDTSIQKVKNIIKQRDTSKQVFPSYVYGFLTEEDVKLPNKGILQKELTQGQGRRVRSRDFDYAEAKQREAESAFPSLNKPTQSSFDESRIKDLQFTVKNTANDNAKKIAKKGTSEQQNLLADFGDVREILTNPQNKYNGPSTPFAETSANTILENGGITVQNGQVINPEEGYQVAYDKKSEKIFGANEMDKALDFINKRKLRNFGVWINKDKNNEIVIDLTSTFVKDPKTALQMGELAEQDSVLDWKASKEKGEMVFIPKAEYMDRLKKLKGV